MVTKGLSSALSLAVMLIVIPSHQAAGEDAGDPVAGRALAQRWCDTCHVVDQQQQRGTSTGAPTFAAIANMKSTTAMALRVFLQTPHGRMPDLHLTRDEISDVSAYILSLKR
nr:c-type cytochrome [uncultured Rhodopila sp.]